MISPPVPEAEFAILGLVMCYCSCMALGSELVWLAWSTGMAGRKLAR